MVKARWTIMAEKSQRNRIFQQSIGPRLERGLSFGVRIEESI